MVESAVELMRDFGREMQERQQEAGGLLRSALGKARGTALRVSLVIQYMWWCAEPGFGAPPSEISERAFSAAAHLLGDYVIPMAERVFGDAAARAPDRNAATLARWILRERPTEVHVRYLQREVRLPGLGDAEAIHAAAAVLVEARWLRPPVKAAVFHERTRVAYGVNPRLWDEAR